ncbi:hypothetical protein [Agarilytica rhodophyticola]|uniref:hypothetical protein n=1 Tax=Agarilytica rhodophyticola TaxID=1737490 RepID=UPI000B342671|nr:hypothetical protein [Agarilytica rhodophyticola]
MYTQKQARDEVSMKTENVIKKHREFSSNNLLNTSVSKRDVVINAWRDHASLNLESWDKLNFLALEPWQGYLGFVVNGERSNDLEKQKVTPGNEARIKRVVNNLDRWSNIVYGVGEQHGTKNPKWLGMKSIYLNKKQPWVKSEAKKYVKDYLPLALNYHDDLKNNLPPIAEEFSGRKIKYEADDETEKLNSDKVVNILRNKFQAFNYYDNLSDIVKEIDIVSDFRTKELMNEVEKFSEAEKDKVFGGAYLEQNMIEKTLIDVQRESLSKQEDAIREAMENLKSELAGKSELTPEKIITIDKFKEGNKKFSEIGETLKRIKPDFYGGSQTIEDDNGKEVLKTASSLESAKSNFIKGGLITLAGLGGMISIAAPYIGLGIFALSVVYGFYSYFKEKSTGDVARNKRLKDAVESLHGLLEERKSSLDGSINMTLGAIRNRKDGIHARMNFFKK